MDNQNYSPLLLNKLSTLLGSKSGNIEHLESARDKLLARKDELERDLKISNKSSDSELSQLLTRAQVATSRIEALHCTVEPLRAECDSFVTSNSELCVALNPLLDAEELRLKERCYRALLRQLTQLSDAVRQAIAAKQLDEALVRLRELHVRAADVEAESRCPVLAEYCRSLVSAWRGLLLRRISAALDASLAELRYPFISTNSSVHSTAPGPEAQLHLEAALTRLAALSKCGEEPTPARAAALAVFPSASLPLRLLLRPLVRRFVYHFHGQKRTNDPTKPDWYMGQVLQWISDHEQFLETSVEPTLAKVLPGCRPRLEFCRGLVELVVDKLLRDLPELQYDDATLSHVIDETLQLQRALAQLGYGGGGGEQPGPLVALCVPAYLRRWVALERKFALERVDQMLASETAWCMYGDIEGGVTELADGVLTMLQSMTERYRLLPEPGQRLQFLYLQLELLDDLRVRLLQLLRNEKQEPLSERCCALLNTVHHLRCALSEWGEQPAFLHLQFFRQRLEATERKEEAAVAAEHTPDQPAELDISLSLHQVLSETVTSVAADPDGHVEIDGLQTTAFDASVQLFERIETDIIQMMVNQVLLEVRARSKPYRKDKWFDMPALNEFVSPSLTPSACPMMQVLTQCLQQLKRQLASSIFHLVWRSLADHLCDYLYDELIMANKFNQHGATQLRFDITSSLLPVFCEFVDDSDARPAAFQPLLSAAALLTLPTGSALLLRNTLRDTPEIAAAALIEAGAPGLKPEEAAEVLLRRTKLSVI